MDELSIMNQDSAVLCLHEIASVWANVCDNAVDVPSFGFMILYGYLRPDVDFGERSCLTIV